MQAEANQPDREVHRKQDRVIEGLDNVSRILEKNARIKSQPLGDGRFREEDENGNAVSSGTNNIRLYMDPIECFRDRSRIGV